MPDPFSWSPHPAIAPDAVSQITYEVSVNEPVHPDPEIAGRFFEERISNCRFGCKIYKDPKSNVRVLAHNSAYGCNK